MADGVECDTASRDPVKLDVDGTAHDFRELDVDAMVVEVAAHRVEGLLGVEAAIHGDEIVRHEEQANRGIGREPIDERLAGHGLDRTDEMGERSPMNRVDALQQLGEAGAHRRVRMRLQLADEPGVVGRATRS